MTSAAGGPGGALRQFLDSSADHENAPSPIARELVGYAAGAAGLVLLVSIGGRLAPASFRVDNGELIFGSGVMTDVAVLVMDASTWTGCIALALLSVHLWLLSGAAVPAWVRTALETQLVACVAVLIVPLIALITLFLNLLAYAVIVSLIIFVLLGVLIALLNG